MRPGSPLKPLAASLYPLIALRYCSTSLDHSSQGMRATLRTAAAKASPSLPRTQMRSLSTRALTPNLRPELQSLRSERAAAAEQLEFARSQKKPFLNLAFSGGYARFTNVLARELLAGGAGLALPLVTGDRIDGQIEEAEAQVRVLESREEALKQQVALKVRTAWLQLQNAIDSLPMLRLQAKYAQNAARLAQERYQEQIGSFVEVSTAQASLAEASASQSVGVYDVKTAEAEFRRAVGRR